MNISVLVVWRWWSVLELDAYNVYNFVGSKQRVDANDKWGNYKRMVKARNEGTTKWEYKLE